MKTVLTVINTAGIVIAAIAENTYIEPNLQKALDRHHDAADGMEVVNLTMFGTDSDGCQIWRYNLKEEEEEITDIEEVSLTPCELYE